MSNALAIFAKAPVAGQVKTRLCPPLTPEQAADLCRCFLLDTVERMCGLDAVQVFLAITPADSAPLFRSLLPFPVRYQPQRGAALGLVANRKGKQAPKERRAVSRSNGQEHLDRVQPAHPLDGVEQKTPAQVGGLFGRQGWTQPGFDLTGDRRFGENGKSV